jgi:WD40 repeat protein
MEEDEGGEELVWNPDCLVSGHSDSVASVVFSPDGKQFVSGSSDRLLKIWSTETGVVVSSFVGLCGVC